MTVETEEHGAAAEQLLGVDIDAGGCCEVPGGGMRRRKNGGRDAQRAVRGTHQTIVGDARSRRAGR